MWDILKVLLDKPGYLLITGLWVLSLLLLVLPGGVLDVFAFGLALFRDRLRPWLVPTVVICLYIWCADVIPYVWKRRKEMLAARAREAQAVACVAGLTPLAQAALLYCLKHSAVHLVLPSERGETAMLRQLGLVTDDGAPIRATCQLTPEAREFLGMSGVGALLRRRRQDPGVQAALRDLETFQTNELPFGARK
jgi:superinfection exclusion protein B